MPDPASRGPADAGDERAALLAAYDAQLRGEAEVDTAPVWDRAGPLWRAEVGDRGFVSYESLAGYDVPALVVATREHFAARPHVTSVEWKTRGHDVIPGVPDLDALLRAHGFEPEEVETVMVGEAARLTEAPELRPGLRVERLTEPTALAEAGELQREVFGYSFDLAELAARRPDRCEFWGVRDDADPEQPGRLVCVGRLEKKPGSEFAGLWGGGTRRSHRGLGAYRALTAARARSALAAGHRLLQSDCTVMSRPILERSGLVAVTTTTPYVWTRG